ncbi:MAG: Glu-tRNA(Gln) amidotransferase subunit GatD [Candidatus Aenigmatarchaeota archaeon]
MYGYSEAAAAVLRKVKAGIGDRVRILRGSTVYEGILLPRPEAGDPDNIVLKLDSGYNIGIKCKGAKIERIRHEETKPSEQIGLERWRAGLKRALSFDPGKPTITILHTGGTIASRVDYRTGAVVAAFTPADIVGMFPELTSIANIRSRLIRNMWSDDMRFGHYALIAKEIAKEIKTGVDGIILTHGTDTLHYTSAALSFILQNLPVPVILVGAQRSSDRPSSDAGMNLICAANFIAKSDFAGVAVCSHASSSDTTCWILPPNKIRKMHTSRRDTFRPINTEPIATVDYKSGKIEFVTSTYLKKDKLRRLKVMPKMEPRVAILYIHTNMFPEQFDFYRKAKYKGLVLAGTGLGHTPLHVVDEITKIHAKIRNALQKLTKTCVVVMAPQTIHGRINMNVYNKGRDLLALGIIPAADMTPETAFVKLAWLLGNYPRIRVEGLMRKNIAGEISERTIGVNI